MENCGFPRTKGEQRGGCYVTRELLEDEFYNAANQSEAVAERGDEDLLEIARGLLSAGGWAAISGEPTRPPTYAAKPASGNLIRANCAVKRASGNLIRANCAVKRASGNLIRANCAVKRASRTLNRACRTLIRANCAKKRACRSLIRAFYAVKRAFLAGETGVFLRRSRAGLWRRVVTRSVFSLADGVLWGRGAAGGILLILSGLIQHAYRGRGGESYRDNRRNQMNQECITALPGNGGRVQEPALRAWISTAVGLSSAPLVTPRQIAC